MFLYIFYFAKFPKPELPSAGKHHSTIIPRLFAGWRTNHTATEPWLKCLITLSGERATNRWENPPFSEENYPLGVHSAWQVLRILRDAVSSKRSYRDIDRRLLRKCIPEQWQISASWWLIIMYPIHYGAVLTSHAFNRIINHPLNDLRILIEYAVLCRSFSKVNHSAVKSITQNV